MTDKEKIKKLNKAFDDVIWMAIRYADGRHTYAPSMVRDAIASYKTVNPDWKPKEDQAIEPPKEVKIAFCGDYLYDIVNENS
jgi:hypothetical protein